MKVLALQASKRPKIENGTETVRMKFGMARRFLNPVNLVIQIGFRQRKGKGTAIGRAMALTLHSAMEGLFPDIRVNPAKAKLSVGVKAGLFGINVVRSEMSISLSWAVLVQQKIGIDADDDRVVLCAYAVEQELAAINEVETWRNAGRLLLDLPPGMGQLPLHLYLIVHDRNKLNCSNSQYLGLF